MSLPRSVYIAFEVFPRPKGASSHIASMLKALESSHGPVLLLCLGFGDMPSFQKEGKILIRRCKLYHPNMLKRAGLFAGFVAEQLELYKDALELCVFRDPWGGLPAVTGGGGIKTLFEVNALPSWELDYTYPGFSRNYPLKHKIMDMEQCCLNRCDQILTVSRITASALAGKGVSQDKISIISNCAPEGFFQPRDSRADNAKGGRRIGYVGSLHPWQGVPDAVDAFALVKEDYPDVQLTVISGGHKHARKLLRKKIRKLGLEERVTLSPPLPRDLLIEELRSFEFTLAPLVDTPRNTWQGCCPVKIIESMAAGVPVLATNLAPVRALIEHGRDGWLVNAGSPRELALGMATLLGDQVLKLALAEQAAQRALAHFHPRQIHRELAACFSALCC